MSFFKESARRLRFGVFVLPASSLLGRHCLAPVSQSTLCLHAYRSSLRRTQTCWAQSSGLNTPFLPEQANLRRNLPGGCDRQPRMESAQASALRGCARKQGMEIEAREEPRQRKCDKLSQRIGESPAIGVQANCLILQQHRCYTKKRIEMRGFTGPNRSQAALSRGRRRCRKKKKAETQREPVCA